MYGGESFSIEGSSSIKFFFVWLIEFNQSFNSYPCGIVGDIDGSAGMILEVL